MYRIQVWLSESHSRTVSPIIYREYEDVRFACNIVSEFRSAGYHVEMMRLY